MLQIMIAKISREYKCLTANILLFRQLMSYELCQKEQLYSSIINTKEI